MTYDYITIYVDLYDYILIKAAFYCIIFILNYFILDAFQ